MISTRDLAKRTFGLKSSGKSNCIDLVDFTFDPMKTLNRKPIIKRSTDNWNWCRIHPDWLKFYFSNTQRRASVLYVYAPEALLPPVTKGRRENARFNQPQLLWHQNNHESNQINWFNSSIFSLTWFFFIWLQSSALFGCRLIESKHLHAEPLHNTEQWQELFHSDDRIQRWLFRISHSYIRTECRLTYDQTLRLELNRFSTVINNLKSIT